MYSREVPASIVAVPDAPAASSFDEQRSYGTGLDATTALGVGDMNGDGSLDLVAGNFQQQSAVYLNDGRGNFTTARPFGAGDETVRSLAVGDVNGDGALDIVVGSSGVYSAAHQFQPFACNCYLGAQSLIYLNDGAGNFATAYPFGGATDTTTSVAVGDVNGDGTLDVVAGRYLQESPG